MRLIPRAKLGGAVACWMTGCIAGLMVQRNPGLVCSSAFGSSAARVTPRWRSKPASDYGADLSKPIAVPGSGQMV